MQRLQFAFQGGGAKLVPLIAAAKAARDLSDNGKAYQITSVAGTSAGAIAATMLALDIEPVVFKERLSTLGDEYFNKIITHHAPIVTLGKLIWGAPVYNAKYYKDFLEKLFCPDHVHLRQARRLIKLYASDVRNGTMKVFDGTDDDHNIVDSVFASSAIPFIFATYKSGKNVDGGILNNLPVSELLRQKANLGEVLGFSFKSSRLYTFDSGISSYMMAIAGTVVDGNVRRSMLELDPKNLLEIDTSLGMLDFKEALAQLKNASIFGAYYKQAADFITTYLASAKPPRPAGHAVDATPAITKAAENVQERLDRAENILNSVIDFHSAVKEKTRYLVKKKTYIYKCVSLYKGVSDVMAPEDTLSAKEEVETLDTPIAVYGATLLANQRLIDPREVAFRVVNKSAKGSTSVEVTSLALPPKYGNEGRTHSNVMVFLHEPIAPPAPGAKADIWEFSYHCTADEPLSYLSRPEAEDRLWFENSRPNDVEELNLVCHIPVSLSDVEICDLPPQFRPTGYTWITGAALSREELNGFELPSPGYRSIGWRVTNVKHGFAGGFQVFRPRKP